MPARSSLSSAAGAIMRAARQAALAASRPIHASAVAAEAPAIAAHVAEAIRSAPLAREPFHHLVVEPFFPPAFLARLIAAAGRAKGSRRLHARREPDGKGGQVVVSERARLLEDPGRTAAILRAVFLDEAVKRAAVERFFERPSEGFLGRIRLQREFDLVFTPGARRLSVHTDLPGKVISVVVALPAEAPSPEAEAMNGTVLYDASLAAVARAPYRANAACLFAPHLESYHGFASIGPRDVFVTFYEDPVWMARWHALQGREAPPFDAYKDLVAARLAEEPLKEIGGGAEAIARHRARSAIDGPMGRVSGSGPRA